LQLRLHTAFPDEIPFDVEAGYSRNVEMAARPHRAREAVTPFKLLAEIRDLFRSGHEWGPFLPIFASARMYITLFGRVNPYSVSLFDVSPLRVIEPLCREWIARR